MIISPANKQHLGIIQAQLKQKGSTNLVEPIELTETIRELKIDKLIQKFFKHRPVLSFDGNTDPKNYIFFVQINNYKAGTGMFTQFLKPHITIIVGRKDEQGMRAISINPRDYSFGPDTSVRLTREQYAALKAKLNIISELDVTGLLRYESTQ